MDEKAEINPQNYKIITKIGEGAFGKVFKVEKDNKYYALKKIVITNLTKEEIDNYKNLIFYLVLIMNIQLNIIAHLLIKITSIF